MSVCAFPDHATQFVPLTVTVIGAFKFLIMAFVTFSAMKMLRANIQIELYNDSGPVFTFVLLQALLFVLSFPVVPVFYASTDYETRLFVLYSVLTFAPLLTVIAGLVILFLPKYRKLPQDYIEGKDKSRNVHEPERSSFSLQQSNSASYSIPTSTHQRLSWPYLPNRRRSQTDRRHYSHSSITISPNTSSSYLGSQGLF